MSPARTLTKSASIRILWSWTWPSFQVSRWIAATSAPERSSVTTTSPKAV
ncbi:hypothetical protein [Streptomyces purpureus]|nr:hypothetical protein [Streptomyces purpureus]